MVVPQLVNNKTAHFADRFWPSDGVDLCREINLAIKLQVNVEGSGLMIEAGLCGQKPNTM